MLFQNLQHHEVSYSKLNHVQESSDSLLDDGRSKAAAITLEHLGQQIAVALARTAVRATGWASRCSGGLTSDMVADQVGIILLDGTAEELERHDEQYNSDTGPGEHAGGGDVP